MASTDDGQPAPAGDARRFDQLRPWVGARLQLLLARTTGGPLASALIGYSINEFVIARTPFEGGLAVRVHNDELAKARLFTGTHLVEFDTSVLRQYGAPAWYWHLAYPTTVRISALRATQRAAIVLEGRVQVVGQADPLDVRIVDLSEQGARVTAGRTLGERDASLRLIFSLADSGAGQPVEITAAARIRSVKVLSHGANAAPSTYAHGLQFEQLGERERILVQNYVLQRLADGSAGFA